MSDFRNTEKNADNICGSIVFTCIFTYYAPTDHFSHSDFLLQLQISFLTIKDENTRIISLSIDFLVPINMSGLKRSSKLRTVVMISNFRCSSRITEINRLYDGV